MAGPRLLGEQLRQLLGNLGRRIGRTGALGKAQQRRVMDVDRLAISARFVVLRRWRRLMRLLRLFLVQPAQMSVADLMQANADEQRRCKDHKAP